MSKKLAEGIDGLVLDVKMGGGAFMKTYGDALRLAQCMVDIGRRAGRKVVALITDMDQPLGRAVGNALEVAEALEVLRGEGPGDVRALSIELAAWMVRLGGLTRDLDRARAQMASLLDDGSAMKRFRDLVAAQGGDTAVIDRPEKLSRATHRKPVLAARSGYVAGVDAATIGTCAMNLGAGRARMDSSIDPSAGITLVKKRGDRVRRGEALAVLHGGDPGLFARVMDQVRQGIVLSARKPPAGSLLKAVVSERGVRRVRLRPATG